LLFQGHGRSIIGSYPHSRSENCKRHRIETQKLTLALWLRGGLFSRLGRGSIAFLGLGGGRGCGVLASVVNDMIGFLPFLFLSSGAIVVIWKFVALCKKCRPIQSGLTWKNLGFCRGESGEGEVSVYQRLVVVGFGAPAVPIQGPSLVLSPPELLARDQTEPISSPVQTYDYAIQDMRRRLLTAAQ
jgi:hypothetical protein